MGRREDRLARNEALFREVNERVRQVSDSMGDEPIGFVCECGLVDCTEEISLNREEYERVRSSPITFAIAVGHELPDIESVVEANDRFAVVAKDPEERSIARRTDPRATETGPES